jgi:hypothetical protein
MVTEQDIQKILATGKRSQGPLIDAAIDNLLLNGRTKQDAFAELGEALGMKPATVGQGYFRRKAQRNGPARAPRVVAAVDGNSRAFQGILQIVEQMVEQRVAERLEAARKALA